MNNGEGTLVIVDDDEMMRIYLSDTLSTAGYQCRSFAGGAAAMRWMVAGEEDATLFLSDINMPGMNGLDLLRTVKSVLPDLPFILISGLCDLPMAQGALRAGASDYLLKPVRPADLLEIVSKYVHVTHSAEFDAVRDALKRSLEGRDLPGASQSGQLIPIFDSLGLKSVETLQHSQRVAAFALLIARDLGLDRDDLRSLELGAMLHDIGKAGIPHNVLMKPGKLTREEWSIIKMHPQLGLDLLHGLPGLEREKELVFSHQERFDGGGYPRQLAGTAIPLSARVFSIADTLDAITSDRAYRPAQNMTAARAEIHRVAGSQIDPVMIRSLDRVSDAEFEAARRQFPDVA